MIIRDICFSINNEFNSQIRRQNMSMRTVVAVLSVFAISPCFARTITVDDNGPADFNNIQAAINDSVNGDTVIVQPGTYTGDGNRDIDFMGKVITLRSSNGPKECIINCEDSYRHRGFYFHSSEQADSIVDGFTIMRGRASVMIQGGAYGGGIYCSGSSPTIRNCIITLNKSYYPGTAMGGGIYCTAGSTASFVGCTISNNEALGSNSGDFGLPGDPAYGGGIYSSSPSCNPVLENCVIVNNLVRGGNGFGGSAGGEAYGGGVYGRASLSNCTVSGNSAQGGSGNVGYGGGLYSTGTVVQNSIFWDNSAVIGLEISGSATVSYSDVKGGWAGSGNINTNPFFADFYYGDYHLQTAAGRWDPNTKVWIHDINTSPCVDAGDPNSAWTKELWPNGKRINMGAYGGTPEASMSLSTVGNIANLDNDPCDFIDYNDLKIFAEKWCFEKHLLAEDLDRDGNVDFNDFAIFGEQYFLTHPVEEPCEPGIIFTISQCEQGMSKTGAYELMDSTRFTITVNGRYIHFEDMMVGNCCTPLANLRVEMTVNSNVVTIYEHEQLPQYPCTCICDYPVDADAGPFESGTYTLTVYEDYGGLIGSTTFTIN